MILISHKTICTSLGMLKVCQSVHSTTAMLLTCTPYYVALTVNYNQTHLAFCCLSTRTC